ncbi:Transcription-repair-coupling factor [Nitrospina watsonii]|uniref:Transcription-repair-coupling factor n=2 Tax=Nitrospina watsonii TaxID=1323948 RepID=A0ABM9HDX7_9BACT|nr:Transcription-repair-coupling factor [Nitrospina watsonii]
MPATNGWDDFLHALDSMPPSLKIEGLSGAARAWFLVRLWKTRRQPLVVVTADQNSGEALLGDLRFFLKHENLRQVPQFFPTWELLPYEPLSPLSEVSGERLDVLDRLGENKCPILVVPLEAAMQFVMPRRILNNLTYPVKKGETVDRELLELCLVDNGFRRTKLVEEPGEFSSRGDILDLYLPSALNPIRVEFFGDDVESIRYFDVTSQISVEEIDAFKILPVREICLTQKECEEGIGRIIDHAGEHGVDRGKLNELLEKLRHLQTFSGIEFLSPFFYDHCESLFDHVPDNTRVILDEPDALAEKAERYEALIQEEYARCQDREEVAPSPDKLYLRADALFQAMRRRPHIELNTLKLSGEDAHAFEIKSIPGFQGRFDGFADAACDWKNEGLEVTVVAPTKGHVRRVNELLLEKELSLPVMTGQISAGFQYPEGGQVFVAEHEIFGRTHKHRYRRKPKSASFQRGFKDLKVGDLLVHVDYGIGKYMGTRDLKTSIGGGEFMEILYGDDQKLYLPMDGLAYVQKYQGASETNPVLSQLGGAQWKRQKKKIKESLREMAGDLLKIYAAREVAEGNTYSTDPVLMQEFSDSFEYVETDDQLKAIDEIHEDMEKSKPMDRLICGDVGYGKTEVAMRAAFRAVLDKKQVAVLVPTTILAQQHLNTFRERFQMYPVSIDMVSRFRTPREQKEVLRKLKEGKLDIIIGTHRLLSKDVQFHNLGLMIIDEEQRFGVKHKEQLKKLRSSLDILTLSATPIPRTLHFSLMGVRDLSVIETPPSDRLAIKTYIRKFDEKTIRDAILREMDRGGQIYFVHNKVHSIHSMAALIKKIVPEVRIGIGHGQLHEHMLEKVMQQFIEKEIDLLLCTSIVESGLDIPSANTILINRADQFGLAQLYQLRGRVGRYKHQAYAYLLIPGTMAVSEDARKRLMALEEMSDLGAGFQMAARDMEIRGTGNMLGKNQSGHISTVGFDLYCKLLEETIREAQGEKLEEKVETEVDFQVRGYIAKDYIVDLNQRLEAYQRLQLVDDLDGLTAIRKEWNDRFGAVPPETEKLLALMEVKIQCQRLHITKVQRSGEHVYLKIAPSTPLKSETLTSLLDLRLRLVSEYELSIKVDNAGWKQDIERVAEYLNEMVESLNEK